MPAGNIVFSNLRAEMAREGVGIRDIADVLHVNRDTAERKLSRKSKIMLDDACKIKAAFFPTLTIQYL